jgi:PAS domain S-box-containing protein
MATTYFLRDDPTRAAGAGNGVLDDAGSARVRAAEASHSNTPGVLDATLPQLSRTLGTAIAAVGLWYLTSWLAGASAASGLMFMTMKTNASLCLLLLGTALAIGPERGRDRPLVRGVMVGLGAVAAVVGGLTVIENLSGWDIGIDQLIATEVPGALGVISPNRMGIPGSVSFLFTGVSVVALARARSRMVIPQLLALLVALAGLVATTGYFYRVPAFYGVAGMTAIALPTALTLLALGVAVLTARPREGLMAPLMASDPGAHLLRRLLPAAVLVPLGAGWVRLEMEQRGWVSGSVATGLLMLFFIVWFSTLLVAGANRVRRWADAQTDYQREQERLHRTISEDRERLYAVNERLRSTFDSAGAGIAQIDLETGRFIRVNAEFSRMTGHSEPRLLSMTLADLTHPNERAQVQQGLQQAQTGAIRGGYFAERRYIRADGSLIHVELHGAVVRDATDHPVEATVIVIDVTARKRAERELDEARHAAEQARAVAEEANQAKDHFLSVLSHELRTPLSPVLTGAALLEKEGLSAEGRAVLAVILRNVALEARLIDDLLDLTRITRGKVELDRRPIDVHVVIQYALEVCAADIAARGLRVTVHRADAPCIVHGDAARLQQVFWNLLKNAIKFSPQDGCVEVQVHRVGREAVVAITDSGIGIEATALEGIFDAFAQAERSITRRYGGLGLGLTISRALVELHGGRIGAASEGLGKGARFTVRLPVSTGIERPADPVQQAPGVGRRLQRPLRILLVEDHADTAEMMVAMLESERHHVVHARTVAEALDASTRQAFDLVVSDLGLPDGSGLLLIRQLRKRPGAPPGIALSGYGQEADIRESRAAGFAEHLVKPVDPLILFDTIGRVVPDAA